MANYQVIDAYGSVLTVASSVIGGVNYPIVKIPDGVIISNASVSGTVGASVIGTVPITQGGTLNASVSGTVGASIIGTVPVVQSGTVITSVSGAIGASIVGQLPAGTAPIGSVATLQGTNPWIVNFQNSSVIAVSSGSVLSVPTGSVITVLQAPSVVGTYAEDLGHTNADKGLFTLAVRNDTMNSFVSADLDYSPVAVGPVGEVLTANAPINKWVQGKASCFTGVIQPIIAAQGASIFTYITGVQATNASANNAYLTFYGATDSVVGYTPVPANGGSNLVLPNAWKTNANGAFSASVSGVASVFLAAEGFISKI